MKLTRVLNITEKEFYDFLERDLLDDIYKHTNKRLGVRDIKGGLKYRKYDEKSLTHIDISILDYKRGSLYKAEIKSIYDTIRISYETKEVDNKLKIIFNQHIESFESKKHNKFIKFFSEGVYLGRMTDTLYDIQNKIIKERESLTELSS